MRLIQIFLLMKKKSSQYLHFRRSIVQAHSYGFFHQSTFLPIPNNIRPDKDWAICRDWTVINKCNQNTANEMQLLPRLTWQGQGDSKLCSWTYNITLKRIIEYNLSILKIPPQQAGTPTTQHATNTRDNVKLDFRWQQRIWSMEMTSFTPE